MSQVKRTVKRYKYNYSRDDMHPAVALVLVVAMIGLFIAALCCANPSMDLDDYQTKTYVVEYGDTLWSIGSKHANESTDVRQWIYEVEKLNDIDNALIYPGDVIDIYVPK